MPAFGGGESTLEESKSQEEIDLETDLDRSFSNYMTDDQESPAADAAGPEPVVQQWNAAHEKSQEEVDVEENLEKSLH